MYNPTFSSTTNRITSSGYSYDSSGNTTTDPMSRTFVYDGENKQVSVETGSTPIGTYSFDGDGKRIKKIDATGGTLFLYDAAGRLVEEVFTATPNCEQGQKGCTIPGPVTTSYVYAGSRLLSTETSSGPTYLTTDHLGSPRINTDSSGNVVARHDYLPFGEEIFGLGGRTTGLGYGTDTIRKQFTGYERDNEIELDFAEARMYNFQHGRFTSVDPENAGAFADNPQTWNAYAHVGNNPINITDPTGLDWYFNDAENRYKWFEDKDEIPEGWARVVGNTGERGSFSYEAVDRTFVTLDPYSNNFQTNIATKADAMKLGDRLYQLDPQKRAFAAEYNKNYDTKMALLTAMAVGDIVIIAGPVIGTSGAGTATLGLTETAATVGTAAAANPEKTSEVIQTVIQLSGAVLKNFTRFASKVPVNARSSAAVETLENGGYRFTATSPGNVSGSRAVYEKIVDASGKTIGYVKTTFAPDGRIIHVKDKLK